SGILFSPSIISTIPSDRFSVSADEKLIMVLKYKEKHSIKDIMGTLGLSESAVKMRLKRARQRVNDLYATHGQKSKPHKN
uniref:RNA polymerase sigma factor n=1 Tax=Gelidibacter sp. TaxID=2018083 RepID=UPI00404A3FD0